MRCSPMSSVRRAGFALAVAVLWPATALAADAAPVPPPATAYPASAPTPATLPATAPPDVTALRGILPEEELGKLFADRVLLASVLQLFEPEDPATRARAAADLALRADPRVVGPLAAALLDRDGKVRMAAAAALANYSTDAARKALARALRSSIDDPELRGTAARALGEHMSVEAGETLLAIRDDKELPRDIRDEARDALKAAYPEVAAALPAKKERTRIGLGVLVPVSAMLGSFSLATVGMLGPDDATRGIGITAGTLGGILIGGGATFLITLKKNVPLRDGFWIAQGGYLGTYAGLVLGALAVGDGQFGVPRTRIIMASGVAGELVGLVATILTRKVHHLGAASIAMMNLSALAGSFVGLGSLLLTNADGPKEHLGATLGGGALLYTAAALLAPHMHFTPGDLALTALISGQAAWIGAWLPTTFRREGSFERPKTEGGLLLGAGVGFVAAAALAQAFDFTPAQVRTSALLAFYASFLGAGIPMLARGDVEQVSVSMLTAGVLGTSLGLVAGDAVRFAWPEASMTMFGTGWGFLQGIGIAGFIDSRENLTGNQISGSVFVGLSTGAFLGWAAARLIKTSAWDSLAVTSTTFWGGWYGIWTAAYLSDMGNIPAGDVAFAAAMAGNGGLVVGAFLLSPVLKLNPVGLGIASLGGLAGAALGSLAGVLASAGNPSNIILFNLGGTTVGLVGGAILAAVLKVPGPRTKGAEDAAKTSGWPHIGKIPIPMLSISPSPFDHEANTGFLVTATVVH